MPRYSSLTWHRPRFKPCKRGLSRFSFDENGMSPSATRHYPRLRSNSTRPVRPAKLAQVAAASSLVAGEKRATTRHGQSERLYALLAAPAAPTFLMLKSRPPLPRPLASILAKGTSKDTMPTVPRPSMGLWRRRGAVSRRREGRTSAAGIKSDRKPARTGRPMIVTSRRSRPAMTSSTSGSAAEADERSEGKPATSIARSVPRAVLQVPPSDSPSKPKTPPLSENL